MRGIVAFFAWAAMGGAIGWGWAAIKAALIASDPAWGGGFYILTIFVWLLSIAAGCGLLASFCWMERRAAIALGLLAVFTCVLGELTHDYRRWLSAQPPTKPADLTTPLAWWSQASNEEIQSRSRRRGTVGLPRWLDLGLQWGIVSFVVGGAIGKQYDD